jgi:PAS domain S-box-containing protein
MKGRTGRSPGHALLDHVPEMVTISDRGGKIVYANPATELVSGYAPEEFETLDPFEQIHPEDRPRSEEAFGELLRNPGLSLQIEHRIRHKDGTWRWVEVTFRSLFEAPEVEGLLATVRDVTESKRAEEALRASEERFRTFADTVPALIWQNDPEGPGGTFANRHFVEFAGRPAEDLLGEGWQDLLHPDDRESFTADFLATARRRRPWHARVRARRHDGEWRWLETFGRPVFDPDGTYRGYVSVTPDVTATIEAEEALRASEEKYSGVFGSIDEGFVVAELLFDDEGKPFDLLVLETNPSFDRMLRTTNAVGKRALEIFPDAEASWFEAYGRVVETGESLRFENYLAPLDSWFDLYISRIGGAGSRRFAIVFNDITERKRRELNQRFIIDLDKRLGGLSGPEEIEQTAIDSLGEFLDVSRCFFPHVHEDKGVTIEREYRDAETTVSIVAERRFSDYVTPDAIEQFLRGETMVCNDVAADPHTVRGAENFTAIQICAFAAVPVFYQGKWVGIINVTAREPRVWREDELTLLRETAVRVYPLIERASAEEALRASGEKYRTLFESIDEGFCIVEVIFDGAGKPVDYRFLEVNPAFERHTGLRDAAGKRMRELEPRHEEHWFETYGRIARTGEPERFQNAAEHLDGRFYDVYAFRIGVPEERKVAILFADITRRREAEEERLRLRALEASARAEAAERERIGRELHDRVAHTMGVVHQSLQLHAAYATSDPPRAAEKLKLATEATKAALDQTRDLSAQLTRPGTEETRDGLGAALRDLLDTHVPPGVEATLSVAGDESAVPSSAEEQAYLVMREAVRNALAHSGCTRIEVSLEVDDAGLRGRIEDDGSGFDPHGGGRDDRTDGGLATGVGLRSMRERMELLGGRLDVSSEPGWGTAVEMRAPLAD